MRLNRVDLFVLSFTALVASVALAQAPVDYLTADQVKQIVSGRTWVIGWQRDLANAATVTHWDFKSDGTVCARFIGAKAKDRCADEGKWTLRGETLCWELQRIGETYGYKSACVRIRKFDAASYEAIAEGGKLHPPLFYPLK
jgi:hypothetical protein